MKTILLHIIEPLRASLERRRERRHRANRAAYHARLMSIGGGFRRA